MKNDDLSPTANISAASVPDVSVGNVRDGANGTQTAVRDADLYERLLSYALYLLGRRAYTVRQMREKLQKQAGKLMGGAHGGQAVVRQATDDESARADLNRQTGAAGFWSTPVIDQVLRRLLDLNYLNDLDFCRRFVRERCRTRPRGRYVLERELRQKGVPKEVLGELWDQESLDETALAREALKSQWGRLQTRYGAQGDASKRDGVRDGVLDGVPDRAVQRSGWLSGGRSNPVLRQKCYAFLLSRGFSHDVIKAVLHETLTNSPRGVKSNL